MRAFGLAFFLLTTISSAQAPSFEVASVKPNTSGSHMSKDGGLHNSRYWAQNSTLQSLFEAAFGVPRSQIVGPNWIETERFDIEARAAAGSTAIQVSLMLQTLLTERFHAATHREARAMPAYDMVVAKGGLKVPLFDPAHPTGPTRGANVSGMGTMPQLADQLARVVERPVIDRTGAEGRYAYALSYAPLSAAADTDKPDIFAAVEQQLGLRLVAHRQGIEVLVIDHVERPTGN